jgi:hypothetical protein
MFIQTVRNSENVCSCSSTRIYLTSLRLMYVDGRLQDLESEKVKTHLTILAKRLKKACLMINPPSVERPSRQILPFAELQTVVEKEHKKLLARKVLIERRKEEQERQMLEMVRKYTSIPGRRFT